MKTYTFFYGESDDIDKFGLKKYIVSTSRFDTAFKSFSNFILFHESNFINFLYTYIVFNGHKTQFRSLSSDYIVCLTDLKNKHNSSSK